MAGIVKQSISLTAAKGVELVANLLQVAIISRLFTLNEYGLFSQILLVTTLIASIFNLGLPGSVNYFLARCESTEDKAKYMSQILLLCNCIGIVSVLITVIAKDGIITYFHNENLKQYIVYLSLLPWMQIVVSLRINVFVVMDQIYRAVTIRVFMSLVLVALPITFWFSKLSFKYYILMYVLVQFLFYLYVIISIHNLFGRVNLIAINTSMVKEILTFSVPLGLATVVGTINIELDKLVIARFFDINDFAVYTNMSKEMPAAAIAASIVSVIMPKMVRSIKNAQYLEVLSLWKKTINFTFFVVSPMIMFLLVMSKETIILLYTDKYLSGINIFRIFSLVLYFRITYFGLILNASGKTRKILLSSVASLVLNLILSVVFLRLFGFSGPAWATFVSLFVIIYYQLKESAKILCCRILSMFPWRNMFMILLKDIGVLLLVILIKKNIFYTQIPLVTQILSVGILWLVISYFLYLFSMKKELVF